MSLSLASNIHLAICVGWNVRFKEILSLSEIKTLDTLYDLSAYVIGEQ